MMYETGEVESLKELLDKFLMFAQKYNETTVSWQLIDDRSDSFFGSTLKIPLRQYYYDGYRGKKIWMINSSDFFDNIVYDGDKSIHMWSMYNTFQQIFDGAHVDIVTVVDENDEKNIYPTATGLLNALKKRKDLPDVIFFGGVTDTMLEEKSLDSYDALVDYCKEKNIELRLFYFSHDNKNKYEENVKNSKHQFFHFSTNYMRDPMNEVIEVQEEFEKKNDSIFFSNFTIYWREKDVPKKFPDRTPEDEEKAIRRLPKKESFSRFMKKIDLIMNVMLKTYRPFYYASFQYRRITGSSYEEFFNTKHNVMSEEINKVQGVGERTFRGKDGIQAFNDTGEMIATGLHMSYDPDLWLCEQGNVTCEAEADDGTNHMNLLPFWDFRSGSPYKRMDIPEYPATGCPWLTIADRNKSEYSVGKDNKIKYYFSKSNKSATIVFRVMDMGRIYKDCWQTLVFGCFKYDTYSTIPPLYVAGGNQALVPDVWVYYPSSSRVNGLRYLLDMKNPCLSNSNLAYPTDFGGSHMSNFRVLCYDGKWRDVFSMQQTYTEYQYYGVCRSPEQWGVPINYPTSLENHQSHLHKPKQHLDEVYRTNKPKYNLKDRHLLKNNLEVSIKPQEGKDEHNIHGVIENCYIVPDFDKESGELETKYNKYVLAPNGWDERLWHYPWYLGRIYWGGENQYGVEGDVYNTQVSNERAYKNYHVKENHYEGNENKINTKLLLKTGEVEHIRDFDLDAENNITKDNANTEQRRKLMELYISINNTVGASVVRLVENPDYVPWQDVISRPPKMRRISGLAYYWTTTGCDYGWGKNSLNSPIKPCAHTFLCPAIPAAMEPQREGVAWLDDLPFILSWTGGANIDYPHIPETGHGPVVLQFYEGYLPSDGRSYSFGQDDAKILKTWRKIIDAHKKYNSKNDFIVLIFGGHTLDKYKNYTQEQYVDSFENKRPYTALDEQIFEMLKEVDPVIMNVGATFYKKMCPTVGEFRSFTYGGQYFTRNFSDVLSAFLDKLMSAANTGQDDKYIKEWDDYPTITELQFYADGRTLLVDWGDNTEFQYYTGWENLTKYRHYSDGVNKRRYRTRMRHIYPDKGNYVITIYAENNDSYKNTFKLHKDLDRHQGIVQFFAEVPVRKELPVYDEKENLTDKKKIVDVVMKLFNGFSVDGATVPREKEEKYFGINPDFYYTVERPKYDSEHLPQIGTEYNKDGLVKTELDAEGKEFVVTDQPLLGEANGERERYSQEEKVISSNWLGSLINYQLNGRFEDIFENQDKTWWMILQRTGETDKLKEDFYKDFFGGRMRTRNLERKDIKDLTDFYFYEKNIVEDKKSWIHIYESTFKNIYFKGVRDSAYLDIHNIEYWDVQIHLCKRAKLLYVDHFPEPKKDNKIRFNIYSDTVFHVVDMSGNMKHYPFYCKKEQIDKFSKANPELTFKELIV